MLPHTNNTCTKSCDAYHTMVSSSTWTSVSSHIDFRGHHTDVNGIAPLSDKVKAIQEFPVPTTIKQLRRFIRMINFYRRIISNCSTILNPLTNLLQRKNKTITSKSKPLRAFRSTKTALVNFTKLAFIENDSKT